MRSVFYLHLKLLYLNVHHADFLREFEVGEFGKLTDMDLRSTSYFIKDLLWIFIWVTHEETIHKLLHKVVIESQVELLDMIDAHSIHAHMHYTSKSSHLVRAIS